MREILLAVVMLSAGLVGCIGDGGESLDSTQANATNGSATVANTSAINATNDTPASNTTQVSDNGSAPEGNESSNETTPGPIEQWEAYIQAVRNGSADADPPRIEDPGHAEEHVVVAVVDTGVNPFHQAFRKEEVGKPSDLPVQAVDQASGEPPLYVPIEPADSMDQTEWLTQALEPRTLYSFAGTNLMFYSVAGEIDTSDSNGHGTGTTGMVARNAPNATIVVVQHDRDYDQATAWAANQTWIDVVSASIGIPLNGIPDYACYETVGQVRPECAGYGDLAPITRKAVESGKIWVNSAGNDPTPHLTDRWEGPPWTIGVGGVDPYRMGEAGSASKVPDVVADYIVEDLPAKDSTTDTYWTWGTSYSAPTVSGMLADAILDLREQTGYTGSITDGELVPPMDVTNDDVRSAMNQTAIYWGPTDYRPDAPGHPAPEDPYLAGTPIAPGTPWAQMGWGYVNASLSDEIAEVLTGEQDASKSEQARAYMDARQQARQAMWS